MEMTIPFVNKAEVMLMDMGYEIGTMFTSAPFPFVTGYTGTNARPVAICARHYTCSLEMPGIGDVIFTCDAATDQPIISSFGGSTEKAIAVSRKLQVAALGLADAA